MARSITNGVKDYHQKCQEKRARLIQLSPEDLFALKVLVEKYFPFVEARLIISGFIPFVRHLYLRVPDKMAVYYPNNVFRIEEATTLTQALETLCGVGCLTLPNPAYLEETHPHNTSANRGGKPTITRTFLLVPNGMTSSVRGDATYWKFATITNFTFFYQFNGLLWAKNVRED